jgi:hypothetical protein
MSHIRCVSSNITVGKELPPDLRVGAAEEKQAVFVASR